LRFGVFPSQLMALADAPGSPEKMTTSANPNDPSDPNERNDGKAVRDVQQEDRDKVGAALIAETYRPATLLWEISRS
jgi:hypothetical protein